MANMHLLALIPTNLTNQVDDLLYPFVQEMVQLGGLGVKVYDSAKQTERLLHCRLLKGVLDLIARRTVRDEERQGRMESNEEKEEGGKRREERERKREMEVVREKRGEREKRRERRGERRTENQRRCLHL
jgi:hypothetical protein